jgi:SEC-C motif domain protein
VEFRAHYVAAGAAGAQHELSRFVRDAGAWRYLDGVARSAVGSPSPDRPG